MKLKVRKDFDPAKQYRVNVSGCTEDEKKEVQQAFFDAGFPWEFHGKVYLYLDAAMYTNTQYGGNIIAYCMYGSTTYGCNMTAKEFLDLVYEADACIVERNIFISQAYALYKNTSPKYDVFGAMFDAGCRFPEEV